MKLRTALLALTALSAVATHAGFAKPVKSAVRSAVAELGKRAADASALKGKAITVLPVKGDEDGACERMVVGALVESGLECVVSNDETGDTRFRRILEEIRWDEKQTTLKSIDTATVDELGRLRSTQILLEAHLEIGTAGRKNMPYAELSVLAYEVSSKRFVWSADVSVDGSGRAWPDAGDFNVKVEFRPYEGAIGVTALALAAARNDVAAYGYRVNGEGVVDLELSGAFSQDVFDRSGEYLALEGEAHLKLVSRSGGGVLYEKTFSAKGARALGEREAVKNLAAALLPQIKSWLDEILRPGEFFRKHRDFAAGI